jgi:hypothetical protein
VRRERDRRLAAADLRESLLDLGHVGMRFQPVREQVFARLDVAEAAGATASRAGDAALRVDHDALRLHQPLLEERCQGEQCRRGITARVGQARGLADPVALPGKLGETVGPAVDETMVAPHVHDANPGWHLRQGLFRLAGGKGCEENVQPGELRGHERLDHEVADGLALERREALRQSAARRSTHRPHRRA